jgi:bifunctional aspartokinase / homoserine dehydrogenase 1
MRVIKFGGSSLATPERIREVISIIRQYASESMELTVVVSAISGVTNTLANLCNLIPSDKAGGESLIRDLEERHLSVIKSLLPVTGQPSAMAEVISLCNELSDIADGAFLVGEVTLRTRDLILSFGERLSAFIVSQVLKLYLPDATCTDARKLIKTDASYGRAKIDFDLTNDHIRKYYEDNKGVKVVTGFIASASEGQTTTLGRNGSDYTASVLGAALMADTIEIWSDTDGVMTADPSLVHEAKSISRLSYSEAMELSHFGAKVLFPASLYPAMVKQIPIKVKNSFNPGHAGTIISRDSSSDNGFIKGITSLDNICIITVEGSGMVGVAGISARLFNALSQGNISVILISQASSEHSICVAVLKEDSDNAQRILKTAFSEELASGLISSVNSECNLAVIAVVGENMRRMPGVAARVFSPLGRNGINVKAISQGSSELNISFVIHKDELKKALRVLHQALFHNEIRQLHLYVAGTGAVGSRLLEMIESTRDYLGNRNINLLICGLINKRKMMNCNIPQDNLIRKSALEKTGDKASMNKFIDNILVQNYENSVFIDVTAADEPVEYYERLLSGNIAVVAANKRANTGNMQQYASLHEVSKKRNVPFHYETNVGAGLPVINVIRNILAGGDKVLKIEAVLSGTINWLFSEYDGTIPFSDLVRLAREKGFTEPDPRDDLSGTDVARKCLILARECGWKMEMENIRVVQLMPDEAALAPDLESFFKLMKNFDQVIKEKYSEATNEGKKVRYVAAVEDGVVRIEMVLADKASPFFSLEGTENCIILTTNYYQKYPMVIKGPGAGVDVTSAGLLADIVRIAEDVRL